MQQFVVPQFIDVEDKIFGPITVRQFLILLAAGLIIFLAYRLADFTLFVIFFVLVGGLALLFAFIKINGQNFHYFMLNIIQYVRRPGMRVWWKDYNNEELEFMRKEGMAAKIEAKGPAKVVRREHIRDLSLIVNTGGYYRGEE